jgi:hypothetical protein
MRSSMSRETAPDTGKRAAGRATPAVLTDPGIFWRVERSHGSNTGGLTMRLSDAGLRRRQSKILYLNHRPPLLGPPQTRPRDRSNRLLEGAALVSFRSNPLRRIRDVVNGF